MKVQALAQAGNLLNLIQGQRLSRTENSVSSFHHDPDNTASAVLVSFYRLHILTYVRSALTLLIDSLHIFLDRHVMMMICVQTVDLWAGVVELSPFLFLCTQPNLPTSSALTNTLVWTARMAIKKSIQKCQMSLHK